MSFLSILKVKISCCLRLALEREVEKYMGHQDYYFYQPIGCPTTNFGPMSKRQLDSLDVNLWILLFHFRRLYTRRLGLLPTRWLMTDTHQALKQQSSDSKVILPPIYSLWRVLWQILGKRLCSIRQKRQHLTTIK